MPSNCDFGKAGACCGCRLICDTYKHFLLKYLLQHFNWIPILNSAHRNSIDPAIQLQELYSRESAFGRYKIFVMEENIVHGAKNAPAYRLGKANFFVFVLNRLGSR